MESLPIVPSRRQFGTVLILKMFRYRRKKKSKHRVYYRCVNSDCKSKITRNISINLLRKTNFENYLLKYFEKHPTENSKSIWKKTIA